VTRRLLALLAFGLAWCVHLTPADSPGVPSGFPPDRSGVDTALSDARK
jgi:hypothetical protein